MKSNLSRWGLSRYYITKEGILYFKTLNKGWVKKPFRLLESKKRKKYTQSLLNDEGKYVYGYLHRLVAMAYINKPPHNKLSLRKERRVLRLYYKGLNIKDIQLRLRLKSSTSIRRILKLKTVAYWIEDFLLYYIN